MNKPYVVAGGLVTVGVVLWLYKKHTTLHAMLHQFVVRSRRWVLTNFMRRSPFRDICSEGDPGLDDTFLKATKYVSENSSLLQRDDLLELYGWFKQATLGNCPETQYPEDTSVKRESWRLRHGVSPSHAKVCYVSLLSSISPEFQVFIPDNSTIMSKGKASTIEDPIESDQPTNGFDAYLLSLVTEESLESFTKLINDYPQTCIQADPRGMTPLHWAADRGATDRIQVLLDNGAPINARDDNGETPLHLAVIAGHIEAVELLLSRGADQNIKNHDSETPCQLAAPADDSIKHLFR